MAENFNNEQGVAPPTTVEATDRGFFDFGKKEDDIQTPQVGGAGATEEKFASDFEEKVHVSEDDHVKEPKHETLLEKFHHDDNGSSSSSSDEEGDDEEKKKRKQEKREKKGLKDKLLEKLPGQKDEEDAIPPSTEKPHVEEAVYSEPASHTEEDVEKKGFLDKIKEKLPGKTKPDDHHEEVVETVVAEGEGEEKKGIMDRIKDKIPGFGHKVEDEEKKDHE